MTEYSVVNCDVAKSDAMKVDNNAIRSLIVECCEAVGLQSNAQFCMDAGDGAIVVAPSAILAEGFSETLHERSFARYNANARKDTECCSFKIGIATGKMALRDDGGWNDPNGIITTATRLQESLKLAKSGGTGVILIDTTTYSRLPPRLQALYGDQVVVAGKTHDRQSHQARIRRVVPPAPWDQGWKPSQKWQNDLNAAIGGVEQVRFELDNLFVRGIPQRSKIIELSNPIQVIGAGQEISDVAITVNKKLRHILERSTGHQVLERPWTKEAELWRIPSQKDYFWLVDGLDGSRHVLRHLPFYTLTLSLVDGSSGQAVLGVTYVPPTRELFFAISGGGAYLSDWGKEHRLKVSDRNCADAMVYIEFPNLEASNAEIFNTDCAKLTKVLASVRRVRGMDLGSFGLAYVAKGAFEAYIDFSRTSYLHNMAAGCLFVKEAGGTVLNIGSVDAPRFVAGNQSVMKVLEGILNSPPEAHAEDASAKRQTRRK